MTKKIQFLVILMFASALGLAQNFEGKIVYQSSFKSKIPNVTDESFTAMMGSVQDYVIKGGNYKSTSNGTLLQWQTYLSKDNKIYTKLASSPSILYNEGAENKNEVTKAEINKNAATILGYKCDELVLTCKDGIQKYYFSNKVKADASLFANHKYGNWYEVLSRTNALPLKMIIDSSQFTAEMVATNVSAEKVDDNFFDLPTGIDIQKSPY